MLLYSERATNTFEFDQGHVTKNQPITMFVLLNESLDMYQVLVVLDCVRKIFKLKELRGKFSSKSTDDIILSLESIKIVRLI